MATDIQRKRDAKSMGQTVVIDTHQTKRRYFTLRGVNQHPHSVLVSSTVVSSTKFGNVVSLPKTLAQPYLDLSSRECRPYGRGHPSRKPQKDKIINYDWITQTDRSDARSHVTAHFSGEQYNATFWLL